MYEYLNCGLYHIWIDKRTYYYLGSTNNFNIRQSAHENALKNNKHKNTHLQNAYNKHKEFHFEIICKVPEHYLLTKEQYLLDTEMPWKREIGYNISSLAHRPDMNEETRGKISDAQLNLGENHHMKTLLARTKMSEAFRGKNNPMKIPEIRMKVSEANMGKILSIKTREKISEAMSGENSSTAILTWENVREIRKLRLENKKLYTYKKLGEMFDVQDPAIWKIINKQTWKE